MKVKMLKGKDIEQIVDEAEAFYRDCGYEDGWGAIRKAILGSEMVALAYDGGRVIGAGKMIGDGSRFSVIVDLVVDKEYRAKGIGTEIVQTLAKASTASHINLYSDPKDPGLMDFYRKAGFEYIEGQFAFKWSRNS